MCAELLAVKTPVDKVVLFNSMILAWEELFCTLPLKDSIILLLSQWALETGHGSSMWCYNLGNVKAQPTGAYDYCFFACNELLPTATAHRIAAADPEHAKITADRADGNSWIWFYPKHLYSCFRGYQSLDAGTLAHLKLMHTRFEKAWPFVASGDPVGFCHALKQQRYYTADEGAYTAGVVSVFSRYRKELAALTVTHSPTLYDGLASATFDTSSLLTPTAEEECRIYSPYSNRLLGAA